MFREGVRSHSDTVGRECLSLDLNQIVREVMEAFALQFSDRTFMLTVETTDGLPRIQGNRDQLADVLFALVFRADRVIRIRTWLENDRVRLSVSDSGSPADTSFMTIDECAEIIADHHGEMVLWRTPTGCSTYTLDLPRQTP